MTAADDNGDGIASLNNALMAEGTTSPYDSQRPREVPIRMEGELKVFRS